MNLVYAFGGPMSEVLAPLAEKMKVQNLFLSQPTHQKF
jgi:hypothetical protein